MLFIYENTKSFFSKIVLLQSTSKTLNLFFSYKYKNTFPGYSSGVFLILYGIFRIFVEFFREPDNHIGYVIDPYFTTGIILCIPMIALGVLLIVFHDRNRKNNN